HSYRSLCRDVTITATATDEDGTWPAAPWQARGAFPSPLACFVDRVYRDLLGRPPGPETEARWLRQLEQGVPRGRLVLELVQRRVFLRKQVADLFRAYLGEEPSRRQVRSILSLLDKGGTLRQGRVRILRGPEYFRRRGGGTPEGFVSALLDDLLGQK